MRGRFTRAETGKRRKGWNAFFDYPPAHPEGTQAWQGRLALKSIRVEGVGNRVRVVCRGFRLGIFSGDLVYTFFPASRLIRQEAVLSTNVPDTAYYYDAGLAFAGPRTRAPRTKHEHPASPITTRQGSCNRWLPTGCSRSASPYKVRYRALATAAASGSVAAFPAPHQYFFPRDFTSNLGQSWHRAWRGDVALGIRQIRDTDWRFYPWMNAPPGSLQRMGMFLLLSGDAPEAALEDALRYTNRDRFPALAGYKTLAAHWHLAYTVQALEKGWDWTPRSRPFCRRWEWMPQSSWIFTAMATPGFDRVALAGARQLFQGLPRAVGRAVFVDSFGGGRTCISGGTGRWCSPKPGLLVGWTGRKAGSSSPSTRNTERFTAPETPPELLQMVRRENGWMYQTHARTKGSTVVSGRDSGDRAFSGPTLFRRGMEGDTVGSVFSPASARRVFKLLDDMRNWGLDKRILGEVDVFQFDRTHELYAHMNVNYVRADRLPDFEQYGRLMEPLLRGDMFISTGGGLASRVENHGVGRRDSGFSESALDVPVELRRDRLGRRRKHPAGNCRTALERLVRGAEFSMEMPGAGLEVGANRRLGRRRQWVRS